MEFYCMYLKEGEPDWYSELYHKVLFQRPLANLIYQGVLILPIFVYVSHFLTKILLNFVITFSKKSEYPRDPFHETFMIVFRAVRLQP